jgi:DNA-3-methyladenine glycosylase
MKSRILPSGFFNRPTEVVARELLGKFLVAKHGRFADAHVITEVEAYYGFRDRASHAYIGRTNRNSPMFGPPGCWYVYLVYGMHWMLNIVTEREDYPAAILIRSIDNVEGPARVTRHLGIGRMFNARPAVKAAGLWIEERGLEIPESTIQRQPRVGVDYAGDYWSRRRLSFRIPGEKVKHLWPSRERCLGRLKNH